MYPLLEVVVRSLCVYFFMIIGIRLFGKNQLSQLNAGDVVLLLLISNAVQNAMVGNNTSLEGGLVAASVLFLANFILKKIMYKNVKFRDLMESEPLVLVKDGVADKSALEKAGISLDELQESVREHGVGSISKVQLSILEVDGNISVVSKDDETHQTHYTRIKRRIKRKAI